MKLKLVIAMLAVGGFVASPVFADHHASTEKSAEVAADTVPAYVVAAAGGG